MVAFRFYKRLSHFKKSVESNILEWQKYYDSPSPQDQNIPPTLNELQGLHKLIILRCIRPDKVVPAVQNYIVEFMSQNFIEPPVFNLSEIYMDSSCTTPLVFVLSPSSDPMMALMKFAEIKGKKRTLQTISLGQGQVS